MVVDVGVPVAVRVVVDVGVPVAVRVVVDVGVPVLLSLGHDAPTQQTEPYNEPPEEHSHVVQQPPFAQMPLSTSNRLTEGVLQTSQ